MKTEVREITSLGEWLGWHRQDITASRIPALVGAHPYATLDQVVAEMGGRSIKGDKPFLRRGHRLEPAILEAVREERPDWAITKAMTYHRIPELRCGATPDAWVEEMPGRGTGLLELKSINEREWEKAHGLPLLYWQLQVQAQMIVTGKAWGVIAAMVVSSSLPLHLFEVEAHPAAQGKLLDAVAEFWRAVDAGEIPLAEAKDEIEALLDDGSHKDLSGDNLLPEWLDEREELVEERGVSDRRIKEIDYELKQRLGTASTAWLPGWAISWKAQHRKEYTVAAQDIRVLRVKRTSGDEQ